MNQPTRISCSGTASVVLFVNADDCIRRAHTNEPTHADIMYGHGISMIHVNPENYIRRAHTNEPTHADIM